MFSLAAVRPKRAPLGGVKGGLAAPNAPVLTLNSESAGLVSLIWFGAFDDGDTLIRQVQASGGDWTSLVDNTSHAISQTEGANNQVAASLNLGNGVWDIRGFITSASTGLTSSFDPAKVLTIQISDSGTSFDVFYPLLAA